jgi:hypothetical protein
MKVDLQQLAYASYAWATDRGPADEHCTPTSGPYATDGKSNVLVSSGSVDGNLSRSLRAVRTLALCQALLFVALVLFICALARATTEGRRVFHPELVRSVYATESARDPFGSEVAASAGAFDNGKMRAAIPSMLTLNGILYHATHPAAIVNNQLVELNQSVMVETERGKVEIKALQITREAVLLEAAGQKVELRLGSAEHN